MPRKAASIRATTPELGFRWSSGCRCRHRHDHQSIMWSNDVTGLAKWLVHASEHPRLSQATLNSLTIQASGTGNDSTAYTGSGGLSCDNIGSLRLAVTIATGYYLRRIRSGVSRRQRRADLTASLALAAASTTGFFWWSNSTVRPGFAPSDFPDRQSARSRSARALIAGTPTLAMRGHQISQPTLSGFDFVTARLCIRPTRVHRRQRF